MKTLITRTVALFIILVFLSSCCRESREPLKIAITKEKPAKYIANYSNWLKRYDPGVILINMYPLGIDSALKVLKTCDGLLVTGGEDVYPGLYGKAFDTVRCGTIDRYRDSLEISLINKAIADKLPVFGICRGLQIINIDLGGTLYVDIPSDFDTTVTHRQEDWRHCFHPVVPEKGTRLYSLTGSKPGNVASNHHQGIEKVGMDLTVSARSYDSLPEAIEWTDFNNRGFLMAVQWHPERMDTLDAYSKPLAEEFLEEAEIFQKEKR
ncbi:MAG: gamma-glutamyl-gamma-aminobutyrate hydrolase family protein [Chlorobi bacterium]|nr:gamma-glutamyl-gamma-aminobutyrate hydrolase family protein [Chlorobiota bacterium]